jgi:DNA polymerase-1
MKFHGLILVDGSSYLYRAFHALPPLTNSKGQPTGAMFGVINMLKRLLQTYEPAQCAVVIDAKGKTFRDDLYAKYKAHRPSMPDELRSQVAPLQAIIKAMGFPLLVIEGVEADDVIGTLACQAARQGLDVLISTGDKDFAQLVNHHIILTNTMTNTQLDEKGVEEKFGVKPCQIIDYLTLIGDTSDNVPGVPGVGPKTATKWLNEYGTLENIEKHAEAIKGKVGENLRAHIGQFEWVKKLVTIHCDVPLACRPNDLILEEPDAARLQALYAEYEFKNLLKEVAVEIKQEVLIEEPQEKHVNDAEAILTEESFNTLLKQLKETKQFAIDTETNSLDTTAAELVGMSFAVDKKKGYYLPFLHRYLGAPAQLNRDTCLKALAPILKDKQILKIFQHAKFDLNILCKHGVEVEHYVDTQLQAYVLHSHERNNMDHLAQKYLHHTTIAFEDVAGKGIKQLTFDQIELERAVPYSAEDAQVTFCLHHIFSGELAKAPGLLKVLNEIEMPLVSVLARMERIGVLIDADCLRQQSHELEKRILVLEEKAYELAQQKFNLSSPKQLQEILYGKLGLPITQKTPTGQPSTSEEVLQDLAFEYELPKIILEHRSLSKLKSTYTDKLPQQISGHTGRIHTSYHQAVVPTGRLSSSDPNLQNIPVRTEEGKKIRKAFIAPPGCKILSADYSQVELRIMAHLSQDERLLQAFKHNEDIHRATASEVFGVPLEKVSADERRNAKAINFGLMYGMSSFGLAKQLAVSRTAAQSYIDQYFARYPGVKSYMDRTRAQAHSQGYVETVYGRRLYLPEINSKLAARVKAAERAAINAPLQGTSADIIKRAMITIDDWIQTSGLNMRMIMQVHDELVFEVDENDLAVAEQAIPKLMAGAAELEVPLIVDVGVGGNWGEAH